MPFIDCIKVNVSHLRNKLCPICGRAGRESGLCVCIILDHHKYCISRRQTTHNVLDRNDGGGTTNINIINKHWMVSAGCMEVHYSFALSTQMGYIIAEIMSSLRLPWNMIPIPCDPFDQQPTTQTRQYYPTSLQPHSHGSDKHRCRVSALLLQAFPN